MKEIQKIMLEREKLYSKYACLDSRSIRLKEYEADIRPNFFRDIDRIIHSKAYSKYMDKTQVFTYYENDYVTKRMHHVQFVSKISRTIGRALSLNEDLIEAIALGHDLGHVPFGHVGEKILNDLSQSYDKTYFMHNVQSVRTLMNLEDNGEGKNISVQVLDGILCHNGEFVNQKYYPKIKTIEQFLNDYNSCYTVEDYTKKLKPMTLEACVVRISDMIAYLGKDIEDAIILGMFDINHLPEDITKILGNSNKQIINTIVIDIINNSIDKEYIMLSDKMYKAIISLKKFNYANIYNLAYTIDEKYNIEKMFYDVFNKFLKDIKEINKKSLIYKDFLNTMNINYLENNTNEKKVIDYIAGMTDNYFINQYKKIK